MIRHTTDSGGDSHDRLATIRRQLTFDDGIKPRRPVRHFGWFAWVGTCAGVVMLVTALASIAPMRAGASAKTQSKFSLPASSPLNETTASLMARQTQGHHYNTPMIALVIDDIGPARHWSDMALALPAPVTLAVLPYVSDAAEWTARAQAAGHEVLLHMPMEPFGLEDPGPGALLRALPAAQNRQRLMAALARVSGVIGVNNHMGSRYTSCMKCVEQLAENLADRGLVFLDSMTSPASAAAGAVERSGVPVIRRDVFLDDIDTPDAIAIQMQRAEQLARDNGVAIIIAHPRPQSIAALQTWLKHLERNGIELVSLRSAMARKQKLERGLLSRSAGL